MPRGVQESNNVFFNITYENNDRDNGKPFFSEMKKSGDVWEPISQDTFLEGKLIKIEKSSYDYKKGKQTLTQNTFKLKIDGGDETYSVDFNYNYYTRSMLNALSSIEDFSNTTVKISIYRNKDGFVSIYTTADGEKSEWTIQPAKLPGKDDKKWLNSFDHFIDTINSNIPEQVDGLGGSFDSAVDDMDSEMATQTEAANKKVSKGYKKDDVEVDESSDLPF